MLKKTRIEVMSSLIILIITVFSFSNLYATVGDALKTFKTEYTIFPEKQARKIGVLHNKFLTTTKGGGDSEYLEFYYNFNAKWKTKGKCKIHTQQFAEFVPVEDVDF